MNGIFYVPDGFPPPLNEPAHPDPDAPADRNLEDVCLCPFGSG